jgi:hypothetical protein
MTTMITDVPVTSRPDAGEARVYLTLKGLPDAYRIYHSVSYYVAPEGRAAAPGRGDSGC